jgi:predicted AAA+ superfamily ATPase
MSIIERKIYLAKVDSYIDKNLIKVFIGQRRVGKSYFVKTIINHVKRKVPQANIIYIDKELYDYDNIATYHELIEFVEKELKPDTNNYLFIDEIQEIADFQKALRHFQNKRSTDIYITGSNADMLSGELATLLSGRYIEININSLSYLEFLEFHQLENNDDSFYKYLKWGGLPYIRNLEKNDEVIFEYLKNILSTIFYKDILHLYNITNVYFFYR